MPEDLRESLGRIRSLLDALHHPVVEVEGFEADDVIASLARRALALEEDIEAVIVSGDKDFYQLLAPGAAAVPARAGGTRRHLGGVGRRVRTRASVSGSLPIASSTTWR